MADANKSEDKFDSNKSYNSSLNNNNYKSYSLDAENVNGRWAMIGFTALLGAYITTGQVIPGIF
mgnify:CR=1 FL=1